MEVEVLKYIGNFGFSAIVAMFLLWMIKSELREIRVSLTKNAETAHKGDQQLIGIVFRHENRLRYLENSIDDLMAKAGMTRRRDQSNSQDF